MPVTAVSAPSRLGSDVGARIADAGGNAVDVAVGSTIVGMVTDPGIIGPGAGCFLTIWPADASPVVVDGYVAMPGLGNPPPAGATLGTPVTMAYGGGMETLVGPASVAVPGAWAALGVACERFGSLAWREILAPAVEVAERGFPLSEVAARYLGFAFEPIFSHEEEFRSALTGRDGALLPAGAQIRPAGLAAALATIAEEGPGSWYRGTIARLFVDAMASTGGWVTDTDLNAYETAIRRPVMVSLGEWEVATNGLPAPGGAVLGALLLLAEAGDTTEAVIDIQRAVLGYRHRVLDGASDRQAAAQRLLEMAGSGDRGFEAPSTIHVSAVDADGLACSVTTSAGYGSGMVIPGTGLALNNSLGELELAPEGLGDVAPGTRLPSNMAPTVARRPDGAVLAVGSPGAARIPTALATVLASVCLDGSGLAEAVAKPRLHVETFEGRLMVAFEESLKVTPHEGLGARALPDHSMYFGGVGAAARHPDGTLEAAADPRRSGATALGGRT